MTTSALMTGGSRLTTILQQTGTLLVDAVRNDRYEVRVAAGAIASIGDFLAPIVERLGSPSIHVVTDRTVAGLYAEAVVSSLAELRRDVQVFAVEPGEATKTPESMLRIWRALTEQRASRRSLLVALGGGVVCDIGAMAAATYMRGIPYINVPTTLLAQVDASLGGKAGADFDNVKNLVGAFHHPVGVVVDPDLLRTLPVEHLSNGFAEVAKIAILHDSELYDILLREADALLDVRHAALPEVIMRAVQAKLDLLAEDPYEMASLDRLLNFGHCLGHPIEAASGYRMPHGFAVARGIVLAAGVALGRGATTTQTFRQIVEMLLSLGLPVDTPAAMRPTVWIGVLDVRRIRNGQLRLVVPVAPGNCAVVPDIEEEEFYRTALKVDQWLVEYTWERLVNGRDRR